MGVCGSTPQRQPYGQSGGPYGSNNLSSMSAPYNAGSNWSNPQKQTNTTYCPQCQQQLQLPAGVAEARCPRCSSVFSMQNGYPVLSSTSNASSAPPPSYNGGNTSSTTGYNQAPYQQNGYQPQPQYGQPSYGQQQQYGQQQYQQQPQYAPQQQQRRGIGGAGLAAGVGGGLLGGMLLGSMMDGDMGFGDGDGDFF